MTALCKAQVGEWFCKHLQPVEWIDQPMGGYHQGESYPYEWVPNVINMTRWSLS